ncbi:DEAD/DEAH box helicase [Salipiger pacificus]|nr:DEAD/DEAH box helicase [Alloyangia pacifica]
MAVSLRWYQEEALAATWAWFEQGRGNGLVVVPTGGGKSVIMAEFMRRAMTAWPDVRFLSVTHVKELVEQNSEAVKRVWHGAPVGIYSAGLGKRQTHSPIVFGGIQSMHRRAAAFGFRDIVIVDEAQLIPRSSDTMYRRYLDDLRKINPDIKIIGFTATPYRLDSGSLTQAAKGQDPLFEGIIYDTPILPLIEQGFLSPVKPIDTETRIDTTGVKKRGGEFVAKDLEAKVNDHETNVEIAREIVAHGSDRKSWLVFATGVDHAEALAAEIREYGIRTEVITGATPKKEREQIIAEYKAGAIRCLVNINVLTTGFDHPGVDLLALARPTESAGLYVQMIGRGLRIDPDKEDCLVLDFARVVEQHGPIDKIKPKGVGDGGGEAPTKNCEQCGALNYASARECCECGSEFIFEERGDKLTPRSGGAAILSVQEKPQWVEVTRIAYHPHEKRGKPPMMRVDYYNGMKRYSEWVCFQHVDFARRKAELWWRGRAPELDCPVITSDAIDVAKSGALRSPTRIMVRPNGKYFDVVSAAFD